MADVHSVSVPFQVPFHDCDPLFVVWHGHYLKYFEVARCALLASFRLDVQDVRELGYKMFVTDARCRYTFPLSYGEAFEVRATLTRTEPLLRVAYRVVNTSRGRPSARGYTDLACTSFDGELFTRPPPEILERLPALAADPLRAASAPAPGAPR